MSAFRIILASLLSFCQKESKLVDILRSSDKNNFAQLFETRRTCTYSIHSTNLTALHTLA